MIDVGARVLVLAALHTMLARGELKRRISKIVQFLSFTDELYRYREFSSRAA